MEFLLSVWRSPLAHTDISRYFSPALPSPASLIFYVYVENIKVLPSLQLPTSLKDQSWQKSILNPHLKEALNVEQKAAFPSTVSTDRNKDDEEFQTVIKLILQVLCGCYVPCYYNPPLLPTTRESYSKRRDEIWYLTWREWKTICESSSCSFPPTGDLLVSITDFYKSNLLPVQMNWKKVARKKKKKNLLHDNNRTFNELNELMN